MSNKIKPQGWVYDLETLSNCFTGVFYNIQTRVTKIFVIHNDRDQRQEFYKFLKECRNSNDIFCGFNNLFFDSPIIDYIIISENMFLRTTASATAKSVYNKAQELISNQDSPSYNKNPPLIRQLDLYKLMHYDRRKISLKYLQGSMRWYNLQDMPIHHSTHIKKEDIDNILEYNINDVMSTYAFYLKCRSEINLRKLIPKLYKFDALNMSSTKIGETIFINAISKALNKSVKELNESVTRNQTIIIKDIIFPYIKFNNPAFNSIKNYLETQKVKELKGFFTNIQLSNETELIKKYINPSKDYYNEDKRELKKLNIVEYDNTFVIGSGGLHSTHNYKKVFKSGNGRLLVDLDFASFYPNLCISNNWFPKHLGNIFVKVYKILYDERVKYKTIAKKDKSNLEANIIQLALKLALNSVYGKLGSEFSPLHDSKTQLGICINGQLSLMQCIEIAIERSKAAGFSIELLFSNTDGFMLDIDERFYEELKSIAKELSDLTGIELEYEPCKAMYQRDVNNFILIKEDGSVKLKGSYEIDKDFHKNSSMRIVSIATANYFINGVSPRDTIKNHLKRNKTNKLSNKDYEIYYSKKHNIKVKSHGIYDFMILKKVDSRFNFYEVTTETKTKLQKSIRYVMTNKGSKIIKKRANSKEYSLLEATKSSYEQVHNIIPLCEDMDCQDMINFEKSIPINYNWYEAQAWKLIHAIEGYGQTSLF